jgi:hypothetical protein
MEAIMRSDILENSLKEIDKVLTQELSVGVKLVLFDENDKELEPEYKKISSFSVLKEE